jgi:integrase
MAALRNAYPFCEIPAPGTPVTIHTLAELFDAYLAETQLEHERYTHYLQSTFLRTVLRELGPIPLEEVTTDLLRTWKLTLSERHTPGTVWRYMMHLQHVLDFAVEVEWLLVNPMQKIRKPSPGRGRMRFLSEEELPRVLAACRASRTPVLYLIVVIALSTGGRKNEIRQLQWPHVDFAAGVLRFLKTKTHVPRSVPLLGEARTLLEALAHQRRPEVPWVFPSPRKEDAQPLFIDYAWTEAVKKAGIAPCRFHDLRHTFASYMAMSGASLRDLAEVLGHQKLQHTMAYSHLLPSHTATMVERMGAQFLSHEGGRHDHV